MSVAVPPNLQPSLLGRGEGLGRRKTTPLTFPFTTPTSIHNTPFHPHHNKKVSLKLVKTSKVFGSFLNKNNKIHSNRVNWNNMDFDLT